MDEVSALLEPGILGLGGGNSGSPNSCAASTRKTKPHKFIKSRTQNTRKNALNLPVTDEIDDETTVRAAAGGLTEVGLAVERYSGMPSAAARRRCSTTTRTSLTLHPMHLFLDLAIKPPPPVFRLSDSMEMRYQCITLHLRCLLGLFGDRNRDDRQRISRGVRRREVTSRNSGEWGLVDSNNGEGIFIDSGGGEEGA